MKIALAQTKIIWENKTTNYSIAEKYAKNQSGKGSELLLFPEMSFTGFSMNTDITSEHERKTVSFLTEIARNNDISIGFGWVRRNDDKCENVYTILDSHGKVISEYVKIHPFSFSGENKRFNGGDKVEKYYINDIPFSTFICYDLRFPELFRAVANDVHAVIVPACWPNKRSEHWKTLLRARAIENQVYVFAVNCQGDIGGQYYSGDSCVISPDGKVLEILTDKEGLIIFEFEDDVEEYRNAFPVLNDRKNSMYQSLYKVPIEYINSS